MIPLVTIRGTAGVRCGFRIGTAWTDEVDRVELARETPVAVVYEVEAESTEVSESEEADGPGPDKDEYEAWPPPPPPEEELEEWDEVAPGAFSGVKGCKEIPCA